MKIKSIVPAAVLLLVLAISCKKEAINASLPYYQFTEDDKTKLLASYDAGDEIVYKNQDDEAISFKILSSVNGKTPYATGTFWGSSVITDFYYDRQEIVMKYAAGLPSRYDYEIHIQRYPVKGVPAFFGYLRFPLWNKYSDLLTLDNAIQIDFNLPVISMMVNGKTYTNVRVFESGKTEVLEPDNILPALPKNVNKIYYDQHAGIIGFDDLNGKLWRLQ